MAEYVNTILEFKNVRMKHVSHQMACLSDITFKIGPGDIVLIRPDNRHIPLPLCDMAEGLVEHEGTVSFLGKLWPDLSPDAQSQLRGQIGRVFHEPGWISSLNIYNNITLSLRHHTALPEDTIRKAVNDLSAAVGLDHVPELNPDMIDGDSLRRYEWISAFLGQPDLVLLEQPEEGVNIVHFDRLIDLVLAQLTAGGAVIWISSEHQIWQSTRLQHAKRYTIHNGKMKNHDS